MKNLFAERIRQLVHRGNKLEVSKVTGISIGTLNHYRRDSYTQYVKPDRKLVYKLERYFSLELRELWNLTPFQQRQPEIPFAIQCIDEANEMTQEQAESLLLHTHPQPSEPIIETAKALNELIPPTSSQRCMKHLEPDYMMSPDAQPKYARQMHDRVRVRRHTPDKMELTDEAKKSIMEVFRGYAIPGIREEIRKIVKEELNYELSNI